MWFRNFDCASMLECFFFLPDFGLLERDFRGDSSYEK
jgi:hypothetical protein